MHTYRGVFGSHVANVLRRLQRICAFYGSHPQFICTSATIANPGQLAERLIEQPVTVVMEMVRRVAKNISSSTIHLPTTQNAAYAEAPR